MFIMSGYQNYFYQSSGFNGVVPPKVPHADADDPVSSKPLKYSKGIFL